MTEDFGPPLKRTTPDSGDQMKRYRLDKSRMDRVYFCPTDSVQLADDIALAISRASFSVQIASFTFESEKFLKAIIKCLDRGVVVRVIIDITQINHEGASEFVGKLYSAGVLIRTPPFPPLFHHKMISIDKKILFSGSMNYTDSSLNNYENIVCIGNEASSENAVARFCKEFEAIWTAIGAEINCEGNDTCGFAPERKKEI